MKNELSNDGYFEIGFPLKLFKWTNGKIYGHFENGFILKGVLCNVFLLIGITLIVYYANLSYINRKKGRGNN
ncbi:MAG: hypothetical protein KA319_07810 [Ferruginibacter sp.]|nr:hypothetical protein [Ferruginibacter sp.]